MTDEFNGPADPFIVPSVTSPEAATQPKPDVASLDQKNEANKLTPEEQMDLFERDLRENDWGHQPC